MLTAIVSKPNSATSQGGATIPAVSNDDEIPMILKSESESPMRSSGSVSFGSIAREPRPSERPVQSYQHPLSCTLGHGRME